MSKETLAIIQLVCTSGTLLIALWMLWNTCRRNRK